jgi:hypothetical protein
LKNVGGQDLAEVPTGQAHGPGGLGVGVRREPHDVGGRGHRHAGRAEDPHEGGPRRHGLQAPGVAARARGVSGRVDPNVRDVAGGPGRAAVEPAVDDDPGADRRPGLDRDGLPPRRRLHGLLARRHAVRVVVDGRGDPEVLLQPRRHGEAVPPGHPARQVDHPGLDVDRTGKAQPDAAQALRATGPDQRVQQLRQPGQPDGRAVGERERDVRDGLERASRQDDADPRVSAADVRGDRVLVHPADPEHLAGATPGGDVGALLGEDPVVEQLGDDVRDGRRRGTEELRDLGAARRLPGRDELEHPRTEVRHDFLQSGTKTSTAAGDGTETAVVPGA